MALVACTQLKKLDLSSTKLTGEWFLVGIDRGPVPSEQRMERALYNTPEFFIFDTNFVFWVCAVRKLFSFVGCEDFFERFFCSRTFHLLCSLCVSDIGELRSVLGSQCNMKPSDGDESSSLSDLESI